MYVYIHKNNDNNNGNDNDNNNDNKSDSGEIENDNDHSNSGISENDSVNNVSLNKNTICIDSASRSSCRNAVINSIYAEEVETARECPQ